MTYTPEQVAQLLAENKGLGIAKGTLPHSYNKEALSQLSPASRQSLANASAHGTGQAEGERRHSVNPERGEGQVLTEAEFQQQIKDYAHLRGWHVIYVRPARTLKGWRTAWGADGKGMKDLILVRERVVWPEIKAMGGVIEPDQQKWHDWLIAADQEAYIWYPSDWEAIEKVLR